MKAKHDLKYFNPCGSLSIVLIFAIYAVQHSPLQADSLTVDSPIEELFLRASDYIGGGIFGIDLLEEKFQKASPAERWEMAETYIQLHAEKETLCWYSGPGNPLWRIFPEEEIAGYVATHIAAMISSEYHEEFTKERRDHMKVHELLRSIGSLRGYALPYLKEMSWGSDGGIFSLGLIAVYEQEARDMLKEIYHTQNATLIRRSNVLKALAHAFNEADADEVRKFVREAWLSILHDTTLTLRDWLSIQPNLLYSMRIAKDTTMLPVLRQLQEALPEVIAEASATANPRAISEESPNLSHLATRYENSLLETISFLIALTPEEIQRVAQQRRIDDIDERMESLDRFLSSSDTSRLPPLVAFARRTEMLIELELAKLDLPGGREVNEALRPNSQPQDAWPEYTEWPVAKRLEVLQGLKEVLEKLHAAAPPEVSSHTKAKLEVAARWLEEESKSE